MGRAEVQLVPLVCWVLADFPNLTVGGDPDLSTISAPPQDYGSHLYYIKDRNEVLVVKISSARRTGEETPYAEKIGTRDSKSEDEGQCGERYGF